MAEMREATPGGRAAKAAERRRAILEAALDEFSERGFAAARIEDIARRGGVAKGTVYLHFRDKEALFEGLVSHYLSTALADLAAVGPRPGERIRDFLRRTLLPVLGSLATSRQGDVIRLMISDGPRFPRLAEIYFRQVIAPGLRMIGSLAEQATAKEESGAAALARFPQLLFAPAIAGLIWSTLFDKHQRLDVEAMLGAQIDLFFPQDAPAA